MYVAAFLFLVCYVVPVVTLLSVVAKAQLHKPVACLPEGAPGFAGLVIMPRTK